MELAFNILKGEVLTDITISEDKEEIFFETIEGECFKLCHLQN